jgi:hypothetical protein
MLSPYPGWSIAGAHSSYHCISSDQLYPPRVIFVMADLTKVLVAKDILEVMVLHHVNRYSSTLDPPKEKFNPKSFRIRLHSLLYPETHLA